MRDIFDVKCLSHFAMRVKIFFLCEQCYFLVKYPSVTILRSLYLWIKKLKINLQFIIIILLSVYNPAIYNQCASQRPKEWCEPMSKEVVFINFYHHHHHHYHHYHNFIQNGLNHHHQHIMFSTATTSTAASLHISITFTITINISNIISSTSITLFINIMCKYLDMIVNL